MSVPSAGPGPLAHCRLEVFKAFPRAELDVPVVFLGTLWDPARIWRVLIFTTQSYPTLLLNQNTEKTENENSMNDSRYMSHECEVSYHLEKKTNDMI